MSKPAVSVIIPVYNTEKYLRRCLESVCNQTLRELEVICVNDASTDASAAILAEFAAHDSRVKVITFERNRGAAVARNAGIDAATGDYLGFVDSDDFVELDFYEKLYEAAVETDAEVAKGSIKVYDNATQLSRYEEWLDINEQVKRDKTAFCFTFTTAIYLRKMIVANRVRFLEGRIHFEDPYFTICASFHYFKISVVDSALYYYCANPCSTSRKPTVRHVQDFCAGFEDVLRLLESQNATERQYVVIFDFIVKQLLQWCSTSAVSEEGNEVAIETYSKALRRCKCLDQWLKYRFLTARREHQAFVVRQLRRRMKGE